MRIDADTKLAAVTGWPLEHTLSPVMHNAAYEALGLNMAYLPLPIREGADLLPVIGALRKLPFVGLNVTMPYKRVAMNMCDEVATTAKLAGAVNTLHFVDGRVIGYNTDGRGLLESLKEEASFEPEGKRVVIVGTGGAAGAALVGLVVGKAAHITLAGRRVERAEIMIDQVEDNLRDTVAEARDLEDGLQPVIEGADLVINATPLGMGPDDPLPFEAGWLHEGQVLADMVYRPAETSLIQAAAARGAVTVGGMGMLVAQGAIAIEIWMGGDRQITAPRDVMRAAAESALASQPTVSGGEEG